MRKMVFLVAGFVLFVCTLAYAYDDGDFQIWTTAAEEFKMDKNLKLVLEEEFRWGDDASEFFYQHYDAGVFYSAYKWLNIGAGYRHIYELKKGKFKLENAPYATATLFFEKDGFAFDTRNRLEYRYFNYQDDAWRYRNKFSLKFPWKFTRMKLQPYISDEILISFGADKNGLNQNRLAPGLGINITDNVKAEIYYMLVSTKSSGKWSDANVLGTKLKVAF